jgi:hypothetical protein
MNDQPWRTRLRRAPQIVGTLVTGQFVAELFMQLLINLSSAVRDVYHSASVSINLYFWGIHYFKFEYPNLFIR